MLAKNCQTRAERFSSYPPRLSHRSRERPPRETASVTAPGFARWSMSNFKAGPPAAAGSPGISRRLSSRRGTSFPSFLFRPAALSLTLSLLPLDDEKSCSDFSVGRIPLLSPGAPLPSATVNHGRSIVTVCDVIPGASRGFFQPRFRDCRVSLHPAFSLPLVFDSYSMSIRRVSDGGCRAAASAAA